MLRIVPYVVPAVLVIPVELEPQSHSKLVANMTKNAKNGYPCYPYTAFPLIDVKTITFSSLALIFEKQRKKTLSK